MVWNTVEVFDNGTTAFIFAFLIQTHKFMTETYSLMEHTVFFENLF